MKKYAACEKLKHQLKRETMKLNIYIRWSYQSCIFPDENTKFEQRKMKWREGRIWISAIRLTHLIYQIKSYQGRCTLDAEDMVKNLVGLVQVH